MFDDDAKPHESAVNMSHEVTWRETLRSSRMESVSGNLKKNELQSLMKWMLATVTNGSVYMLERIKHRVFNVDDENLHGTF